MGLEFSFAVPGNPFETDGEHQDAAFADRLPRDLDDLGCRHGEGFLGAAEPSHRLSAGPDLIPAVTSGTEFEGQPGRCQFAAPAFRQKHPPSHPQNPVLAAAADLRPGRRQVHLQPGGIVEAAAFKTLAVTHQDRPGAGQVHVAGAPPGLAGQEAAGQQAGCRHQPPEQPSGGRRTGWSWSGLARRRNGTQQVPLRGCGPGFGYGFGPGIGPRKRAMGNQREHVADHGNPPTGHNWLA